MIGTTDHEIQGPLQRAQPTVGEIDYLCAQASRWLAQAVTPQEVVWSYAGVRPLLDDEADNPAAVTRDYLLECDRAGAPLLNVWGGKLTTFRRLAEEATDALCNALGQRRSSWTEQARLPGGDLDVAGLQRDPQQAFERFVQRVQADAPWLAPALARRWARAYGSRITRVLGAARSLADLGEELAPGLHEAELQHLCREEWARDADDVLWRRSKLGLHLDARQREAVARWIRVQT